MIPGLIRAPYQVAGPGCYWPNFLGHRSLWKLSGFLFGETEPLSSSVLLCEAVISSFRRSIAEFGQSHVAGILQSPLIPDLVEIGVTDAAEQNLNLYVVFGWIAPRDHGGRQRRCRAGSRIGFRFEHVLNIDARRAIRYAEYAILHAKYANASGCSHR